MPKSRGKGKGRAAGAGEHGMEFWGAHHHTDGGVMHPGTHGHREDANADTVTSASVAQKESGITLDELAAFMRSKGMVLCLKTDHQFLSALLYQCLDKVHNYHIQNLNQRSFDRAYKDICPNNISISPNGMVILNRLDSHAHYSPLPNEAFRSPEQQKYLDMPKDFRASGFAPPRCWKIGPKTDVWSVAVSLLYLAGMHPFVEGTGWDALENEKGKIADRLKMMMKGEEETDVLVAAILQKIATDSGRSEPFCSMLIEKECRNSAGSIITDFEFLVHSGLLVFNQEISHPNDQKVNNWLNERGVPRTREAIRAAIAEASADKKAEAGSSRRGPGMR